ncbi:glycine betaine ABC transporter substrate-binding protein [Mesorhizobium sp. PL10]
MKILVRIFTAIALMMFALAPVKADEKVLKVGSLAWEDQMAVSLVTSKFLEKEGFKVEFVKFSEWGIAYAALQKGDVDILLSNVDYIASDYWAKFHKKLEKVSIVSFGVVQGLVVPSYVPVDSVDQLNTIADKVGGKIIGIEPGSGLMREAHNALKDYDLKYQIIDGSTAAMVAQLKSSLERKEPIVTMLWTPSWMAKVFDVKFLKDPKGSFAPPQAYYWIAKKGFSEKNPHARESLASVYLPLQDNVDINSAMNDGKTIEQAVDDWWQKHQATVEKWSVMSSE